ncbi:uncharacterized protein AMSG_00904 [Thecamonas trahens ATCC 50062]|uniref:Uncharacterized protein n=1 Tax=Thecamonas trahens ATCC 50062 TaxID=461836 RepID=A0A0L0DIG9_THETB|nr:hypothetical protein AMSG_00904 [Thecamonas trahens ATCC 50062]KNC52077.1 hypothetical protein AMSG_00904 [Thecamonas trahens ATCC 50062]|eukprot:XP_013762082.1 hypothetical protein AMSG_00904 [Thecamonas trahens ATCC 50062]
MITSSVLSVSCEPLDHHLPATRPPLPRKLECPTAKCPPPSCPSPSGKARPPVASHPRPPASHPSPVRPPLVNPPPGPPVAEELKTVYVEPTCPILVCPTCEGTLLKDPVMTHLRLNLAPALEDAHIPAIDDAWQYPDKRDLDGANWGRGEIPIFYIHRDRPLELLRSLASLARATAGRGYTVVVHDMATTAPLGVKLLQCLERDNPGGDSDCIELADAVCASAMAPGAHPKTLCEESGSELLALVSLSAPVYVVRDGEVDADLAAFIKDDPSNIDGRASFVLNRVSGTITEYMQWAKLRAWEEYKNPSDVYVVTDPDLVFDAETPSNVLFVLRHILLSLPPEECKVVAPALRIDNLPASYRSAYIQGHEVQFWAKAPQTVEIDSLRVAYSYPVLVDTTFGMYRADFAFARLQGGARVHAPYWVTHLGWYAPLAKDKMSPNHKYYAEHALPITEWTRQGDVTDSDAYYKSLVIPE